MTIETLRLIPQSVAYARDTKGVSIDAPNLNIEMALSRFVGAMQPWLPAEPNRGIAGRLKPATLRAARSRFALSVSLVRLLHLRIAPPATGGPRGRCRPSSFCHGRFRQPNYFRKQAVSPLPSRSCLGRHPRRQRASCSARDQEIPPRCVGHLHVTGGTGPAPDIPKDRRGRSTSRPRLD